MMMPPMAAPFSERWEWDRPAVQVTVLASTIHHLSDERCFLHGASSMPAGIWPRHPTAQSRVQDCQHPPN